MLFNQDIKDQCQHLIGRAMRCEGGTIHADNGILIDGHLTGVTIVSKSEIPVIVSALGRLDKCIVECQNFLNEGEFSGEAIVSGDVELGETSTTIGSLVLGGRLYANAPFADAGDLKIKGMPKTPTTELIGINYGSGN